jgi:hypothetical protein
MDEEFFPRTCRFVRRMDIQHLMKTFRTSWGGLHWLRSGDACIWHDIGGDRAVARWNGPRRARVTVLYHYFFLRSPDDDTRRSRSDWQR